MLEPSQDVVDPRIRRTRLLLQQALETLLATKDFDKVSVQDIADTATVNRATFYDHYPDKFALFDEMVAIRFGELLTKRKVRFGDACSSALTSLVLAVCDYLAGVPGIDCPNRRQMEPHLESAVIAVVRQKILDGLQNQRHTAQGISQEMFAATLSWAIFGAAKEWVRTPDRSTSEEIAGPIVTLMAPMLALWRANQA